MLNREQTEALILEKLHEIKDILMQYEGKSSRPLCMGVSKIGVDAFMFTDDKENKVIDVEDYDYDLSDQ